MWPRLHSGKVSVTLSLLLIAGGCAPSGPKTIGVEGTVNFASRDRPHAVDIFFRPKEVYGDGPTRPSSKRLDDTGHFEVSSFGDGDGLVPGKYEVAVVYYDLRPGGDPDNEGNWIAQQFIAPPLDLTPDTPSPHTLDITIP